MRPTPPVFPTPPTWATSWRRCRRHSPPRELRGLVLAACGDPDRVAAWSAQARSLFPLGTDGFPRHRDGGPAPTPAAEPQTAPPPVDDAPRADLRTERLTTDDVPARTRTEQLAEIAPEGNSDDSEPRRGKWFVPALAGVLTILAAAGIWGAATVLTDAPPAGIEAGEANGPDLSPSPSESGAATTPPVEGAPDATPVEGPSGPTDESRGAHAEDTLAGDPDGDAAPGEGAPHQGEDTDPAPEAFPTEAPPTEDEPELGVHERRNPPAPPEDEEGGGGLLTDLWDGIRDIIGGNRHDATNTPPPE
ncbi:hypothetical protein J4H86_10525 [Spiractinospora alimapuensis]|uniref:hypothetical protein n=1 Tax=Spiractinospora alimapuensis TaxID=2820884 RepID=UPI001F27946B|nr:hypothetical protein [Spiractinospora alimapuensis]QVQ54090.1 hypothetical protein J4H86_10525 [Spiractinospora alimapuensis]